MATGPSFDYGDAFGTEFFSGESSSTSGTTSFVTDFNINGHDYMINWKADIPLDYQTVPTNRTQSDGSDSQGEQTINPDTLWRRSIESWHLGAGQDVYDRKGANEFRFDSSFGMDIWTKYSLKNLPAIEGKTISLATNQQLVVAGGRLYKTDGNTVSFINSLTAGILSFTNCTGHPANNASSIASDGFHVWTAHGSNGVYRTDTSSGAMASQVTGTVTLLGYVRNRLLAANGPTLYDITAVGMGASGALPTALMTHPNANWTWTSFAEGSGFIYAAGFSGTKSLVYKIGLNDDTTALSKPIVAAEPPVGEKVVLIYGYLGKFIFMGTAGPVPHMGWRLCSPVSGGDLALGVLRSTPDPVLCAEGQGSDIWYGVNNFTNAMTTLNWVGLGRLSTEFFVDIDSLQPAFTMDSMIQFGAGTNGVSSVVTYGGVKVFAINGIGIAAQYIDGHLMEDAYLDSGLVTFGMTEPKRGAWVDHHHTGLGGLTIQVSVDEKAFVTIGEHHVMDPDEAMPSFSLGNTSGKSFEFRIVLHLKEGDNTTGLDFHSLLFRAEPQPNVTAMLFATIILDPNQEDLEGTTLDYDTWVEIMFLRDLWINKEISTVTCNRQTFTVVLEDFDSKFQQLLHEQEGWSGFNGDVLLKMKDINLGSTLVMEM